MLSNRYRAVSPSLVLVGTLLAGIVQASSSALVIENVNLLPMTSEAVLPARTVVIVDHRIAAICERRDKCVPAGATRIDGTGKYLMPGLTDMHAHVESSFLPASASEAARENANQAMRQQLRLYVLYGVTTIRDPLGGPENLIARGRIERGEQVGPRLFTAAGAMDGDPPLAAYSTPFSTPEAAIAYVHETAAAGYDFVKVYSTLPPHIYDAIATAAKDVGLPFVGHVPMLVDFKHALESGLRSIEHLSGYDVACTPNAARTLPTIDNVYQGWAYCTRQKIAALAALTASYLVWNVPTLVVIDSVLPDYERSISSAPDWLADFNAYIPPALRNNSLYYEIINARARAGFKATRAVRLALVKALSDAGAPILLGTDTPASGYNVHQELDLLREAGLTPYQVLTAATSEPARYFDRVGQFGTVVVGASADLLLLDANPLESVTNAHRIRGVMVRGDWWPHDRLDAEFAALQREFAAYRPAD